VEPARVPLAVRIADNLRNIDSVMDLPDVQV
jgi:hypothetical protein